MVVFLPQGSMRQVKIVLVFFIADSMKRYIVFVFGVWLSKTIKACGIEKI